MPCRVNPLHQFGMQIGDVSQNVKRRVDAMSSEQIEQSFRIGDHPAGVAWPVIAIDLLLEIGVEFRHSPRPTGIPMPDVPATEAEGWADTVVAEWARSGTPRPSFGTIWDTMGKTGPSMEMMFRTLKGLDFF